MFGLKDRAETAITSWTQDPKVTDAREVAGNAAAAVKASARLLDKATATRIAAAADFDAALSESDVDRAERAQTEAADAEAKARKAYERAVTMQERSTRSLALCEEIRMRGLHEYKRGQKQCRCGEKTGKMPKVARKSER